MDTLFLPETVKNAIENRYPDQKPVVVLRGNGNLRGSSGESYVIAYADKALFFTKNFGDVEFECHEGVYSSEISEVVMRKERYSTAMTINCKGTILTMKLTSFESKDAEPFMRLCQPDSQEDQCVENELMVESEADSSIKTMTPPPIPQTSENSSPTSLEPMEAFAAALMFMATSDDEIAQNEDDYIRAICHDDEEVLRKGFEYYNNHSFEELVDILKMMDHQQKLCVWSNMLELGMSDGVLHSVEQRMLSDLGKKINLEEQEMEAIRGVLLVKNQTSVLSS